ncbi:hypothetical protein B0T26DRAFT_714455 [Lasiosphaeria miniovina]|uniref:Uncharacterized protein n=1 Tax=Lasiosphaeria miniovina TaxID=1954250 RepID=A0AA40ABA6_9PEZI|nr:uncharacterized protein B0T26DRAFT_714455 [Lasiosphaeria miniovina]KAK0712483.1 hypothetical protein B0T26DRAFT_714455 [Lasiosphaeria miniovina]
MVWHKKIMKQKYNDPDQLKVYLDTVYGSGNWMVEVRSNNRWMISLTRPWQESEMENIESNIRVHYDINDSYFHQTSEGTNSPTIRDTKPRPG